MTTETKAQEERRERANLNIERLHALAGFKYEDLTQDAYEQVSKAIKKIAAAVAKEVD